MDGAHLQRLRKNTGRREVEETAFLSVILSEVAAATESKDPYSCKKSRCGRLAQQQVWDCWRPKGSFDSSLRSSLRMTPKICCSFALLLRPILLHLRT
jgi:uncharacterized protein with ATP-grasp and redox domains